MVAPLFLALGLPGNERDEDGRIHLDDHAEDPGERLDLAELDTERVARMRRRLYAWYAEAGARFLRPLQGGPMPLVPVSGTMTAPPG
jgi:hypothetical protein